MPQKRRRIEVQRLLQDLCNEAWIEEAPRTQAWRWGKKTFYCTICFQVFNDKSILKKHLMYKHDQVLKWHNCNFCPKRFKTKSDLHRNVTGAHDNTPSAYKYKCSLCGKRCKQAAHVKSHMAQVHGVGLKVFPCTICGRKFKHGGNLKRHILRVHADLKQAEEKKMKIVRDKEDTCPDLSSKKTVVTIKLKRKRKQMAPSTIASAFTVEAETTNNDGNRDRIEKQTALAKYRCAICDRKFKRRYNFKRHLTTVHALADSAVSPQRQGDGQRAAGGGGGASGKEKMHNNMASTHAPRSFASSTDASPTMSLGDGVDCDTIF